MLQLVMTKKKVISWAKKDPDYAFSLKADLSEFKENDWVAISHKKIVAHGRRADVVHKKAKIIYPESDILLVQVPPRRLVIY